MAVIEVLDTLGIPDAQFIIQVRKGAYPAHVLYVFMLFILCYSPWQSYRRPVLWELPFRSCEERQRGQFLHGS